MNVRSEVLALIVLGCSAASETTVPHDRLSFIPQDMAAWAALQAVKPRFEAVAGLHLRADFRGTPVRVVPPPDDSRCAVTNVYNRVGESEVVRVEIDLYVPAPAGCWPLHDVLAHEIIHAVRAWQELRVGADDMSHSKTGIFSAVSEGDPKFDIASLEQLCEAVDCARMAPEN